MMNVTAAGIDRIRISHADASGLAARFVVWLYFQVQEDGMQTGQELVVSLPFDPDMTFDELARRSFEKAQDLLRAGGEMDVSRWTRQFSKSIEPLPDWTPAPV